MIDPLTVKFYFNKPSPGFLQGTATIGSGLVSLSTLQRNFEELGDARHIIGSGPFVVQDEKPGRELTLVAPRERIVEVMSLVNSSTSYTEQHLVTNGCSELLGEVFGEAGQHARSAFGVAQVPMGCCVEIDLVAELN